MTTKELNTKVFAYILDAIDGEGYGKTFANDTEKLQFLADTFMSEYGWEINRIGYLNAFKEWLQGLPSSFNVDYTYFDIINIAKNWGSLPQTATEKQEDKICANWFNLIANKAIQLMKRHKVLPCVQNQYLSIGN